MLTTVHPTCQRGDGNSVLQYRQMRPVSMSMGAPQVGHSGACGVDESTRARLKVQYSVNGIIGIVLPSEFSSSLDRYWIAAARKSTVMLSPDCEWSAAATLDWLMPRAS